MTVRFVASGPLLINEESRRRALGITPPPAWRLATWPELAGWLALWVSVAVG